MNFSSASFVNVDIETFCPAEIRLSYGVSQKFGCLLQHLNFFFSDVDSSPQGNVNSLEEPEFTIDVADFECALCMR